MENVALCDVFFRAENHFLEVAGVALANGPGRPVASSRRSDRLQSRGRGQFLQNDVDLFPCGTVRVIGTLFPDVGQRDYAHCAEAVIENNECPGNHEHHFRQSEIVL